MSSVVVLHAGAAVEVVGIAFAAAAVLGTAYFSYRAAQTNAQAQEATGVFGTRTASGRRRSAVLPVAVE